jgi:hypothetical protein
VRLPHDSLAGTLFAAAVLTLALALLARALMALGV